MRPTTVGGISGSSHQATTLRGASEAVVVSSNERFQLLRP
jgi:hypothetical protein